MWAVSTSGDRRRQKEVSHSKHKPRPGTQAKRATLTVAGCTCRTHVCDTSLQHSARFRSGSIRSGCASTAHVQELSAGFAASSPCAGAGAGSRAEAGPGAGARSEAGAGARARNGTMRTQTRARTGAGAGTVLYCGFICAHAGEWGSSGKAGHVIEATTCFCSSVYNPSRRGSLASHHSHARSISSKGGEPSEGIPCTRAPTTTTTAYGHPTASDSAPCSVNSAAAATRISSGPAAVAKSSGCSSTKHICDR